MMNEDFLRLDRKVQTLAHNRRDAQDANLPVEVRLEKNSEFALELAKIIGEAVELIVAEPDRSKRHEVSMIVYGIIGRLSAIHTIEETRLRSRKGNPSQWNSTHQI